MARRFVAANFPVLSVQSAVVSAPPLTMSAWILGTSFASSRNILTVSDGTSSNQMAIAYSSTGNARMIAAVAGATSFSTTTVTIPTGTWSHITGVAAATNSRTIYLNGGNSVTSTTSRVLSGLNSTWIGSDGGTQYAAGLIAFPAIWNAALTPAEVLRLSQGADPRTIRPQNLVAFWPLNTPGTVTEYDQNPFAPRRYDLTVTGATPANDPPIWTPRPKRFFLPSVSTETARFYAGVSSKLWTTPVDGGSHTGTPTNGDTVGVWQDQSTPATRSLAFANNGSTATRTSWSSPGSMALPSMSFDGGDNLQLINNALSSYQGLSAVFGSTAKMIVAAVRFTAGGTDNANIYDNTALLADSGGYFGIHLKTASGTHTLYVYNWDGNADSAGVNISLDTDYVLLVRHDGTNINISVLSGSGGATRSNANAASGATSNMTGTVRLANSYNNNMATVKIGEIYFGNSDLGSTNSVLTDFVSRWLPSSGGGGRRRRVIICGGAA